MNLNWGAAAFFAGFVFVILVVVIILLGRSLAYGNSAVWGGVIKMIVLIMLVIAAVPVGVFLFSILGAYLYEMT
ncbi:hypothetical protein C3433_11895 [Citrobacter freundii]|nr:hypothetical protein C3433_11895 [Citrobacter freundii]